MAKKKDLENFEEIRPPFLTIQALLLIGNLSSAAALDVPTQEPERCSIEIS